MHPADATRLGIPDGARVRLRSRRGAVTARAHLTAGITPGTVFMPFHFAEAAANLLTHAALDPVAKIPEYKVCAVAIELANDASRPMRPQHVVGPAAPAPTAPHHHPREPVT